MNIYFINILINNYKNIELFIYNKIRGNCFFHNIKIFAININKYLCYEYLFKFNL